MSNQFTIGSDCTVNRLGFGAMRIVGPGTWGWPSDRSEVKRLLRKVVELGVDLIDTADAYGPEISEYLLAETLHPYDGLKIATKGGLERSGPGNWTTNGRPEHLVIACNNSLRRLECERIDLYQLHAIDDDVPLEESLGALVELQRTGKIRHIGVSNFRVEELERAAKVATVVSVQNRYNIGDRAHEDVLEYCSANNIGFIPWFPLAAGELIRSRPLAKIAQEHGVTPGQIALAWLLHHSEVMLPIPGTSSIQHLIENVEAQTIQLSADDMVALDALFEAG